MSTEHSKSVIMMFCTKNITTTTTWGHSRQGNIDTPGASASHFAKNLPTKHLIVNENKQRGLIATRLVVDI